MSIEVPLLAQYVRRDEYESVESYVVETILREAPDDEDGQPCFHVEFTDGRQEPVRCAFFPAPRQQFGAGGEVVER